MKLKSAGSTKEITYLDNACMGLVSEKVIAAIKKNADQFAHMTVPPTQFTVSIYESADICRKNIAKLFNVSSEEICLVESTTHGLGLIAQSLPVTKDDNIVICDLEFVSDVLCWRKRQQEIGFEIRRVKTKNGHITLDDFDRATDHRTRAIVVSSVQEINGYRTDIKTLAKLAKQYEACLIVDGIQEAGALEVDLEDTGVDVYCTGGHKWLRNPFGTGFMYIRRDLLGDLEPGFYGYFNAVSPDGNWQVYLESPERSPFDPLVITQSASKFETGGTINYLGITGLNKNIELILEYGMANIEKQVRNLNHYLLRGLKERKLQILSSDTDIHSSGICTFRLKEGISKERELVSSAHKEGIFISLRYVSGIGGIRISPHYYNSKEEIDRLLECIDRR
jgi:selenocysteine lyase/cysteine desulfurase